MAARLHTKLTGAPLSVDAAHAFLADTAAGAAVVFTGTVRDHARETDETEGGRGGAGPVRDVVGLTYEAYPERAEPQLAALAAEVAAKWPALAVWIEHRTGDLAVGEVSVVVGVACGHRGEAFEAARHGIDTLKERVAIWKQEHWADSEAHWPGTT